MRLIDADKVLAEFPVRRNHHDEKHGNIHFINGIEIVMEYLDEIADTFPIDAEPVRHGKWKHVAGMNSKCSECGRYFPVKEFDSRPFDINYCPNCGAKMVGGVSDETIHDKK